MDFNVQICPIMAKTMYKKGVGMKTNPSTIGDQSKTKLMMT